MDETDEDTMLCTLIHRLEYVAKMFLLFAANLQTFPLANNPSHGIGFQQLSSKHPSFLGLHCVN